MSDQEQADVELHARIIEGICEKMSADQKQAGMLVLLKASNETGETIVQHIMIICWSMAGNHKGQVRVRPARDWLCRHCAFI